MPFQIGRGCRHLQCPIHLRLIKNITPPIKTTPEKIKNMFAAKRAKASVEITLPPWCNVSGLRKGKTR
jgi:hypothetical protein